MSGTWVVPFVAIALTQVAALATARAIAAGRESLRLRLDREHPAPARVPWHRRR